MSSVAAGIGEPHVAVAFDRVEIASRRRGDMASASIRRANSMLSLVMPRHVAIGIERAVHRRRQSEAEFRAARQRAGRGCAR